VQLAYLVSAYKLPEQLVRLVSRLSTPRCHFFIHVDRQTDDVVFHRMAEPLMAFPNVHFLERHASYYGGFGHVRATLKGIDALLRMNLRFDYVVLLTGQDYPIKSNDEIERFLDARHGQTFLEHVALPFDEWTEGGLDRIERWHMRVAGRYFRFPSGRWPRRRFPAGMKPYGGSPYWCLARESVEYIHEFVRRSPSFVRFFKYVNVPDELFFHTILLNSPLAESIVDDDLRYVEWRDVEVAGGPAVLGRADFEKFMGSGDLFARKFDANVDPVVLDMIDAKIGGDGEP
jgi:Core-2/I-Branching enzyme